MLTEPTKIFTKDEELIEVSEDILNWLETYSPPPLSSNVNLIGKKFSEYSLNVTAISSYQYTPPFETIEQSLVTFFVKNAGLNNGYTDDSVVTVDVEPGEIVTLVPMIFSRYVRIAYKSDSGTNLEIIAQMQV